MVKRLKPSVPNYGASMRAQTRIYREASKKGCEICGTRRRLYIFSQQGKPGKLRCSCKKHLRRIK